MWCPGGEYFDSFQKCLKAYTDRRLGKMTFKITKEIVNSGQSIDVVFSADNEPLEFDTSWYPESGDEILYGVLGGLWFDFPTPFQKGDILCEPGYGGDGIKRLMRRVVCYAGYFLSKC